MSLRKPCGHEAVKASRSTSHVSMTLYELANLANLCDSSVRFFPEILETARQLSELTLVLQKIEQITTPRQTEPDPLHEKFYLTTIEVMRHIVDATNLMVNDIHTFLNVQVIEFVLQTSSTGTRLRSLKITLSILLSVMTLTLETQAQPLKYTNNDYPRRPDKYFSLARQTTETLLFEARHELEILRLPASPQNASLFQLSFQDDPVEQGRAKAIYGAKLLNDTLFYRAHRAGGLDWSDRMADTAKTPLHRVEPLVEFKDIRKTLDTLLHEWTHLNPTQVDLSKGEPRLTDVDTDKASLQISSLKQRLDDIKTATEKSWQRRATQAVDDGSVKTGHPGQNHRDSAIDVSQDSPERHSSYASTHGAEESRGSDRGGPSSSSNPTSQACDNQTAELETLEPKILVFPSFARRGAAPSNELDLAVAKDGFEVRRVPASDVTYPLEPNMILASMATDTPSWDHSKMLAALDGVQGGFLYVRGSLRGQTWFCGERPIFVNFLHRTYIPQYGQRPADDVSDSPYLDIDDHWIEGSVVKNMRIQSAVRVNGKVRLDSTMEWEKLKCLVKHSLCAKEHDYHENFKASFLAEFQPPPPSPPPQPRNTPLWNATNPAVRQPARDVNDPADRPHEPATKAPKSSKKHHHTRDNSHDRRGEGKSRHHGGSSRTRK